PRFMNNFAYQSTQIFFTMYARDLITEEIPPLRHTDIGETALRWMDEFKVSHLPVLKDENFVGVVSEVDILDRIDVNETLDKLFEHLPRPYVLDDAHIYEVLYTVAKQNITVVPILDKEENYLGCTSVFHLMQLIANTGSITEQGGILVLSVNRVDYSLAQIAQIVESNDAKILSSFITSLPDSTKIDVTIKINQIELDRIIRTFERYDYTISATFQKSLFEDDTKLRYEALMNYLNL
ncbi:MAG TPA: CBS domain-containing protein, partial [Crocinitomicaceae bacterium]|nr:CBS domain-containing protein [Crocinitomicaceae bacterium]